MTKREITERPFRCDCVKLKRAIQRKIYEETRYMTPEEQREYFRLASERAALRRKARARRQASETQT
jgi:hypothetical protein